MSQGGKPLNDGDLVVEVEEKDGSKITMDKNRGGIKHRGGRRNSEMEERRMMKWDESVRKWGAVMKQ